MRLTDYLDKGASLALNAPCLTMGDVDLSYGEVQRRSYRFARAMDRAGIAPGAHAAILSENDATAFSCVFGIARAGLVWAPINPRNEAAENSYILEHFDCEALFFHSRFAALVDDIRTQAPKLRVLVCLDQSLAFAPSLEDWSAGCGDAPFDRTPASDLALLPGTGGTTGKPKGVMLTERNLETMTALTLMAYPFEGRPTYLAMAPLTHAAGVLTFPILTLGGRIVIMPKPDLGLLLENIARFGVTHMFLPPTLIYMLLDHPGLAAANLRSLQCLWYGAAPIAPARLEEAITRIGPVMAQLFGQTEAPMMVSMMAPKEHFNADGSIARDRLASAGRPGPLTQVAIMNDNGDLLEAGQTGEIVVRGSLVMKGYYKNPEATGEATRNGWHRTGDIGFLSPDNYLFIVDRAKDMIISGGFNVYSIEVEQALLQHEAVQDVAVVGLPDEKWGEKVCAIVQLRSGAAANPAELIAHVKAKIGSVKAPKVLEVWPDLPRSKVGKVLKKEVRATLLQAAKGAAGG